MLRLGADGAHVDLIGCIGLEIIHTERETIYPLWRCRQSIYGINAQYIFPLVRLVASFESDVCKISTAIRDAHLLHTQAGNRRSSNSDIVYMQPSRSGRTDIACAERHLKRQTDIIVQAYRIMLPVARRNTAHLVLCRSIVLAP